MALSIKSEHADRLARELASETGESITEAVTIATADRLQRHCRDRRQICEEIMRMPPMRRRYQCSTPVRQKKS